MRENISLYFLVRELAEQVTSAATSSSRCFRQNETTELKLQVPLTLLVKRHFSETKKAHRGQKPNKKSKNQTKIHKKSY